MEELNQPPKPGYVVEGRLSADGVSVTSVSKSLYLGFRFPDTDFDLLLLDANGEILACEGLRQERIHVVAEPDLNALGGPLRCWDEHTGKCHGSIEALEGGTALAIERDGVRLWTSQIPGTAPEISELTCTISSEFGNLRWKDTVPADNSDYRVRVNFRTADGLLGHVTRYYDRGITEYDQQHEPRGVFEFKLADFTAGDLTFTVDIDTGFHRISAELPNVTVPESRVEIELTQMAPSMMPESLGKLQILSSFTTFGRHFEGSYRRALDDTAFHWFMNDNPVGIGPTLIFDPPPVGSYEVRLEVNWKGQQVISTTKFEITKKYLKEVARMRVVMGRLLAGRCELPGNSSAPRSGWFLNSRHYLSSVSRNMWIRFFMIRLQAMYLLKRKFSAYFHS